MQAPLSHALTRHRLWSPLETQEVPIIENIITENRNELIQVETKSRRIQSHIEALKRELSQLQNRKIALRKDLRAHRALRAPIRTLPLELLSEIFSLLFNPIQIHYDEERKRIEEESDDDYESDEWDYETVGYLEFAGPPVYLSRVCSTWNSVFRQSPSAWSRITLHLHLSQFRPTYGTLFSRRMEQIQTALSTALTRSENAPLRISLHIAEDGRQDMIPELASLLACLLGHKDRWKTADIHINLGDHELLDQLCAPIPALEDLALSLNSEEGINNLFCQCPSLQKVTFGAVPALFQSKLQWDSLHHLNFTNDNKFPSMSIPNIKDVLSQCKSLLHLSWDCNASLDDIQDGKHPVTLPITSLMGHRSIDNLLPHLHLPNLTSFELHVTRNNHDSIELSPIQEEYRSLITTLHVNGERCPTETLFARLGSFPELHTLSLEYVQDVPIGESWTPAEISHCFPKLRMLIYKVPHAALVTVFNTMVSLLEAFQQAPQVSSMGQPSLEASTLRNVKVLSAWRPRFSAEQLRVLRGIQEGGLHLEVRAFDSEELVMLS